METPLAEFMIKEPVAVSIEDTSLVAASTLRDYQLKSIPVVDERQGGRIAGYISARKMMAYILKEMRASDKQ
jgi:Mg/Co/Ni transporter MgtE